MGLVEMPRSLKKRKTMYATEYPGRRDDGSPIIGYRTCMKTAVNTDNNPFKLT